MTESQDRFEIYFHRGTGTNELVENSTPLIVCPGSSGQIVADIARAVLKECEHTSTSLLKCNDKIEIDKILRCGTSKSSQYLVLEPLRTSILSIPVLAPSFQ